MCSWLSNRIGLHYSKIMNGTPKALQRPLHPLPIGQKWGSWVLSKLNQKNRKKEKNRKKSTAKMFFIFFLKEKNTWTGYSVALGFFRILGVLWEGAWGPGLCRVSAASLSAHSLFTRNWGSLSGCKGPWKQSLGWGRNRRGVEKEHQATLSSPSPPHWPLVVSKTQWAGFFFVFFFYFFKALLKCNWQITFVYI